VTLEDDVRRRQQPQPPAHGANDWDWTTNGCTKVPNGTWVECCNEHDLCYSLKGHDPAGRKACDDLFRDCLRAKRGPARLYHLGVRTFGGLVTSGDPIVVQHPRSTTRPGVHVNGKCSWWFKLKSVEYLRADAGHDDWRLEFGTWPTRIEHRESFKLKLGDTKTFPEPTLAHGDTGMCGDTAQAIVYVRAPTTEAGRLYFFDVHCDGRNETYDLWLPVRERPHDARFKLTVDLVTACYLPM
jgi:hypothetical protein